MVRTTRLRSAALRLLGVRPLAPLALILFAPVYVAWFLAVQRLLQNAPLLAAVPERLNFFWIPTVTAPDPFFVLPLASFLTMQLILARNAREAAKNPMLTPEMKEAFTSGLMKWIQVIALPFMVLQPAGLHFYILILNLGNLACFFMFESAFFRGLASRSLRNHESAVRQDLATLLADSQVAAPDQPARASPSFSRSLKDTPVPDLQRIFDLKNRSQKPK